MACESAGPIRFDYKGTTVYDEAAANAVGATTSTTLRSGLAVPGANDAYVRKYGIPYQITDVTNAVIAVPRGGGGTVLRYRIYAEDGTLMGTVTDNGASAYVDGAALASPQRIYIILDETGGVAGGPQDGDNLTLTTDVDVAPALTVELSAETVVLAGATITWWVAYSGSTYYDDEYKYGGYRHTPALGSSRYSYFDPDAADIALLGTVIEVLDSAVYENPESWTPGTATTIQASLGQTPTFTNGIGARTSRTPLSANYRNSTAAFWNENGNDANPGTWQSPKLTLFAAWGVASGAGTTCVYGGTGASGTGNSVVGNAFVTATSVDADWEYTPSVTRLGVTVTMFATSANITIAGHILQGPEPEGMDSAGAFSLFITDCTFNGITYGILAESTVTVDHCLFQDCYRCLWKDVATAGTMTVRYSNFLNAARAGIETDFAPSAGGQIWHNVFSGCRFGILYNGGDLNSTWSNNLFYDCTEAGVQVNFPAAFTTTIDDSIFTLCVTGIVAGNGATVLGADHDVFWSNTADTGGPGTVNLTNQIGANPRLCDPSGNHFGIAPDSSAYKANGANVDVGPIRVLMIAGTNNTIIDGFIFDGQGYWFVALQNADTITGLDARWCTFQDCGGIAVDVFSTANTNANIDALLFGDNGAGLMLAYGGNNVDNCVLFDQDTHNIHVNQTQHSLVHISTYGGEYGIYFESTAGALTVRDCIFSAASILAVESEVFVALTYCCINGSVGANVSIADPSNIQGNPFYINTAVGSEDLRLRTIEGGYQFDSVCKDAASDGWDMGAYFITRTLSDDSWESYEVPFTAYSIGWNVAPKGQVGFETVSGARSLAGKAHKRQFTISWPRNAAMVGFAQRNDYRSVVELLSTMIQTDENTLDTGQTVIRLHLRPTDFILPGDGTTITGVVDATNLTIYDAAGDYIENAYKGYHASVRWASYANGVVDATNKTVTSAGAGWTVDEWIGYSFRQGIYYFTIISNTATVLTFSDPLNHSLDEAANFAFDIESHHKIERNDDLWFYVEDEGGLLRDGTFEFFVDFIACRLRDSGVSVSAQDGFRGDWTHDRVPDKLIFEEA